MRLKMESRDRLLRSAITFGLLQLVLGKAGGRMFVRS